MKHLELASGLRFEKAIKLFFRPGKRGLISYSDKIYPAWVTTQFLTLQKHRKLWFQVSLHSRINFRQFPLFIYAVLLPSSLIWWMESSRPNFFFSDLQLKFSTSFFSLGKEIGAEIGGFVNLQNMRLRDLSNLKKIWERIFIFFNMNIFYCIF